MKINDFKLERYFATFEFKAKHLLSSSDCETLSARDLLQMADSECITLWQELRLGYTDPKGHPLLRNEISGIYKTIKPDDVCVMAPEEGIFIALNVILDPGDHVIVLDPAYQSLSEIPQSIGCELTRWPVVPENNRWTLDISFLKTAVKKNTKLLILNFPHNPTGFIPEPEDFNEIVQFAIENKLYLLSDEMYRYLEFSGIHRHESACDIFENGITLSGLSKSFGLPGLRTGWLATRNKDLMRQIERFKDYTTICGNALSEILGIIALRNRDLITGKNLDMIKENLEYARSGFKRHSDILTWIEPRGSSVTFPQLTSTIPADQFCKKLIDHKSILLLPASIFNYPGNHFRLGLGRRDLRIVLEEFEYFINEYYYTI